MSESADDHGIQDRLRQLRCHFTWGLEVEDVEIPDLENRIYDEIKFGETKYNVGMHNLLAYVKHLTGQDEDALQSLRETEALIQAEHPGQSDRGSLVTWGNCAWVCFHLGRVAEAQTYLDKVEDTCKKFANHSRYRAECPEMDCEEGWALLKCGKKNYERAQACFKKAVEVEPENPEFSAGYAIATYRLDYSNESAKDRQSLSLELLRKAVGLNPENAYIMVLLALKLQTVPEEDEEDEYVDEPLNNMPSQTEEEDEGENYVKKALHMSSQTYVYRYAAKFYLKKGCVEEALKWLKKALRDTPNSSFVHFQLGSCYRKKMIQIKKATKLQPRGQETEDINELVEMAIREFEETLKLNPAFHMACVYLAGMYAEKGQNGKAMKNFQKALSMKNLDDHTRQDIHFHYGRFQQFHKKSEDRAIIQYKKGLEIQQKSFARRKLLRALEKLANCRVHRNPQDKESIHLLKFVQELKKEEAGPGGALL